MRYFQPESYSATSGRADQQVGKKKVRPKITDSRADFCGLKSRYSSRQVFWLTDRPWHAPSRPAGLPARQWHIHTPCPRLQRWPNATDLHRIPFSPRSFAESGTW